MPQAREARAGVEAQPRSSAAWVGLAEMRPPAASADEAERVATRSMVARGAPAVPGAGGGLAVAGGTVTLSLDLAESNVAKGGNGGGGASGAGGAAGGGGSAAPGGAGGNGGAGGSPSGVGGNGAGGGPGGIGGMGGNAGNGGAGSGREPELSVAPSTSRGVHSPSPA